MASPYETLDVAQRLVDDADRATAYTEQFLYGVLPLLGAGSPEGVVEAPPGKLYIDQSGSTGSVLYAKQTGTGTSGWQLIG